MCCSVSLHATLQELLAVWRKSCFPCLQSRLNCTILPLQSPMHSRRDSNSAFDASFLLSLLDGSAGNRWPVLGLLQVCSQVVRPNGIWKISFIGFYTTLWNGQALT